MIESEATTEKSENQNVLLQSILSIGRKKFYINDDIARGLRSSPLVNEDVDEHHFKSHLRIQESKNQVGIKLWKAVQYFVKHISDAT